MNDTIEHPQIFGIKIIPNWAMPEGIIYVHPTTFDEVLSEKNFAEQIEHKTVKINID